MTTSISRLLMDYSGDVDRIMYIFSEESSKNEETVLFWRRGIEAFCSDEKSLLFSPLELSVKFIYRDMIPTSIDNSLTILRSRKEIAERDYLINRTMFESIANSAVGWVGSLFTTQEANDKISNSREMILVSLLKATMEALLQSILTECETNHDQLLVVYTCQHCDVNNLDLSFPQLVKKAGNRLKLSNESGSVTKNSIRNKGKGNGDENTMGLLLSQMKEPSLVILEDYMVAMGYAVKSKDLKVIKIYPFSKDPKKETRSPMRGVPVNESARDGGQVKCVSDVDIARLKLKSSISLLEKRISSLDDQATTHREKAITFKKQNSDAPALVHLKLRNMAIASRDKTASALLSLMSAYEQIESAEFSVLVTGAYVSATSGLRSARIDTGLSVSSIEDASDAFNEELDIMGDIDASLQESSIDKTGIDDEELCLEFEGLMKEIEKQDREEKERAKSVVGQKWGMRTSLPSVSQPSPIQTGSGKVGAKVESKLKLPIGVRSSTPPARKIGVEVSPMRRSSASDLSDNYGCAVGRIPFSNKPCVDITENRNNRVPFSDDSSRSRNSVLQSNSYNSSDRSLSPVRKQEKYTPAVLTPRRDVAPVRKPLPTPVLPDRSKKNTPKKETSTF